MILDDHINDYAFLLFKIIVANERKIIEKIIKAIKSVQIPEMLDPFIMTALNEFAA